MTPSNDAGPGLARSFSRGARAFTLIEAIAVVILTGIMAIAALVSMAGVEGSRHAAAASMLRRDLSYARERAMATGIRHWVVVSAASNSYSILAEDPQNPGRAGATTITDPATGAPFVQRLAAEPYQSVTIASASFDGFPEVGFDWRGRPLRPTLDPLNAAGTIQLSGGHGVSVQPRSGMVTHDAP